MASFDEVSQPWTEAALLSGPPGRSLGQADHFKCWFFCGKALYYQVVVGEPQTGPMRGATLFGAPGEGSTSSAGQNLHSYCGQAGAGRLSRH